jgi:hypothetical protein
MVALALMLPMGWMDSVPYFCSPTETVANILNSKLTNVHQLPHPLNQLANSTLPPTRADTIPPILNPLLNDTLPADLNPLVLHPYQSLRGLTTHSSTTTSWECKVHQRPAYSFCDAYCIPLTKFLGPSTNWTIQYVTMCLPLKSSSREMRTWTRTRKFCVG